MTKLYLVLLLAGFVSQLNAESADSIAIQQNHKNIIDDVKKLIEELRNAVQGAAANAINEINEAFSAFQDFANGLINGSLPLIESGVGKLLAQLKGLKDKALNAGVDITECLIGREEELTNLPVVVLNGVNDCVEGAIRQAGDAVHEALKNINDIVDIVDKRTKELEKCTNPITLPVCAGTVMAEVTVDIVQLPFKIAQHITIVVAELATLKPRLKTCIAAEIASIPIKGGVMLAEIADCVNQKMRDGTTTPSSNSTTTPSSNSTPIPSSNSTP